MHDLTDEQIIINYLRGDEASLELLVQRYLPLMYALGRRYSGDPDTAADIAQETLLRAWRNLKKFDQSKSFRPWIFTIGKNTALNWLKRRKDLPFSSFESETEFGFLDTIVDSSPLPTDLLERKEKAEIVQRLLEKLPKTKREIVALRHGDELTFKEIANMLKTPLNTVKSHYRRGIQYLKNYVEKLDIP